MKITYAASGPVPSSSANSVHVMKMGQALGTLRHDVTLITPEYNRSTPDDKNIDVYAWYGVIKNFKLKRSPSIKGKPGLLAHALNVFLEAKKSRAQFVYARCPTSALLCATLGAEVVFEQHSSFADQGNMQQKFYNTLLRSKNLKALVVISSALKEHVVDTTNFPRAKIIVAHDGADPVRHTKAPFTKTPNRLQIGYTGHLYEGRGIDIIGRMAAMLPAMDFHIVGGQPEHIAHWKDKIGALGNMHFHGHVAPAEVPAWITNFDILLAPYQRKVSVGGGMHTEKWMSPLKIFEYMASGKPVICSDMPVLHEVLKDNENCLLCAPEDPHAWVAALNKLASDTALSQKIGQNALGDFNAHYSWQSRATNIMAELKKVL